MDKLIKITVSLIALLSLSGFNSCDPRALNNSSSASQAPLPTASSTPSAAPTPSAGATQSADCIDSSSVLVLHNGAAPRLLVNPQQPQSLAMASNDPNGEITISRSTDGGASWSNRNLTNGSHLGFAPDFTQLSNGGQAAAWADNAGNVLFATIDQAGAVTGPGTIARGSTFDFPSIGSDPITGDLFVAFNDPGDGVSVTRAAVGGSFASPTQLTANGSFPTVAARNSVVLVSWRDENFNLVGRVSGNRGDVFGAAVSMFQNPDPSNNVPHLEFGGLLFSAGAINQIGSNEGSAGNFSFDALGDASGANFSVVNFSGTAVKRANAYLIGGNTLGVATLNNSGAIDLFKFDSGTRSVGNPTRISNRNAVEFSITGNSSTAFVALTKSQSPGDIVVGSCAVP